MSDAQNAFHGFHVRHVPMTEEEQAKAVVAQTMRTDMQQLVSGESVSFLDRSPVIGAINPIAAPMQVETVTSHDGSAVVVGTVTFSKQFEGAPACVHGGFIAAYFDEVLGVAQSTSGNPGMTVNLSVNYRSPTPINKRLVFKGWVTSVEGRKIFTSGTLHDGDRLCAESTAIFVSMRPEVFEKMVKMRAEQAK
jgi:acyl-coenzyme A thioesterase PaaI-like protein